MRTLLLCLIGLATLPAHGEPCVDCHAGAPQKSWVLSKHGVIAKLEAGRERRRAPDCAGCHVVEAATPTAPHYGGKSNREQARQAAQDSCRTCHSPRYLAEQDAATRRGLAIGDMKRREAEALLEAARGEADGAQLAPIEKLFTVLRDEDMRHLRLGLAHQSPDYQWWLGQAALDGSLLRIKGAIGELRRGRAIATSPSTK